jgi:hypothetical protein
MEEASFRTMVARSELGRRTCAAEQSCGRRGSRGGEQTQKSAWDGSGLGLDQLGRAAERKGQRQGREKKATQAVCVFGLLTGSVGRSDVLKPD